MSINAVNRVELLGYLGRDPEIRKFQNGGQIALLSVATDDSFRDRSSGEIRRKTDWHRISVQVNLLVDYIEKQCRKGSRVYLSGKIKTRPWKDSNGNNRYTTEIVVGSGDKFITLDQTASGAAPDASSAPDDGAPPPDAVEPDGDPVVV